MRACEFLTEGIEQYVQHALKNPKFQSWFNGSKVVDSQGSPLICYHFTAYGEPIKKFFPLSHFGTSDAASDRFRDLKDIGGAGQQTIAVFLSIKKPIRFEDEGTDTKEEFAISIADQGIINNKELTYDLNKLAKIIRSHGHDGLVYENHAEGGGEDSWVITDPGQVWNIFANRSGD